MCAHYFKPLKNKKMFNSKKTQLLTINKNATKTTSDSSSNAFVNAGLKKGAETLSGNGALKYSTTGSPFVDQFGKMGSYKSPRSFEAISQDMSALWAKNPFLAVCFVFFIRMITRITSLPDGNKTESVQRGSGLKHEGIVRMMWIYIYHRDTFWKNIKLFISVGSWKDIFMVLSYDLQFNGWEGRLLDWDKFGKIILAGLENPNTSELVKKYLPQIRSKSKCRTIEAQADNIIGKWLSSFIFGSKYSKGAENWSYYKRYRLLKSSGTAHEWQQLISQGKHSLVDFNTVHGRALALMVSSKYLSNQGLEAKYQEWIATKPVAKFTGFVHELFAKHPSKKYQIDTLNSQFKGLVETAKKNAKTSTSMIVVRDTSGSMGSTARGTNQSCYDIAKALALFFSEMLPDGHFSNSWIEFNNDAKMHQWKGSTPWEKWQNDKTSYIGSTNFLSVIKLFGKIKRSGVPESEFPTGILCISDGEFNPTKSLSSTNVMEAFKTLHEAGFSQEYLREFKIVLWNLQSNAYGDETGKKFETYGNVPNVYYFSGYDGSIVAFLTGVDHQKSAPKNAEELFLAAMDQEIMKMIEI
jgi:hypothetical protein